jgi:uncharacterized membrane protein
MRCDLPLDPAIFLRCVINAKSCDPGSETLWRAPRLDYDELQGLMSTVTRAFGCRSILQLHFKAREERPVMRTPASIAKHPIHPILVTIPIGLWVFSFICDLTFVLGSGVALWFTLSFYTMLGGLIGALIAAIPGVIDMLSLHGALRRIALTHMALNITLVVLYAVNIGTRIEGAAVAGAPLVLSFTAIGVLLVSGWLGGHMVYVHRVAVDEPGTANSKPQAVNDNAV